ncbi:hypothetical protein GCM10007860_13610 [Chitiniphilus shinanonensis]|uniref:DUF4870 domain-containing protein n=1 Tax=Chitiniphilus shinanonensis TaxID=553088 RepID=A0ABQ6BQC4_9NEIS|nr:DUF4870 domain-containing protein [Chitiniphilus shinanonensis]GLS04215.1 hypothetical protein GCM10007860_13610 [Chitiniphilus shinanonensis]
MLTFNPKPAGEDNDGKPRPPTQLEKGFAALAHLAGILWIPYVPIPGMALVVPFLVLQFARVQSEFVEQHAVQACNFQLLMGCFYVAALVLAGVMHSAFPIWWVVLGSTMFGLWEGAKAINGWPSKYPVSLKLFK